MVAERTMRDDLGDKLPRRRWTRCRALLLIWLPLVQPLSIPATAEEESPEGSAVLRSDRVDGVHRDLPAEIAPIEQGVIVIQLHSTDPVLRVAEHQLLLWPVDGGSHGARLTARFEGETKLDAEIEIAGLPAQMSDFVELPEQEAAIEGQFRIHREEGGYRVETEALPRFIELQVKSRLAGQMVTVCRGLALLAPGDSAECEGLERSLSLLRLPLPEPGETYFIDESQLTSFERDQVDRYLELD